MTHQKIILFILLLLPLNVLAYEGLGNQDTVQSSQSAISQSSVMPTVHNATDCHVGSVSSSEPISLTKALEQALCHNPQTRLAWSLAKKQAAQVEITKAGYLPIVSLSYNYSKGSSDYQVDHYPDLSYDTQLTSRGLALDASWLLFDFGVRRNRINQAGFLLVAAYANHDEVMQTLLFNVAQAYYELVRIQGALAVNIAAEQQAKQNTLAAQARYTAGIGILADKLQAQTEQARATAALVRSQGDLQIARGELASLMGIQVNSDYAIEMPVNTGTDELMLPIDQLLDQVKQSHPLLVAAQAQVDAAQSALTAIKKEGLPVLSLTSSVNNSQQQGSPPAATNNNTMNWGLRVNMPLFDGYTRRNQIRIAESEVEEKSAELTQSQQQVALNVWRNYYVLIREQENIKAIDSLEHSATTFNEVTLGRYKAGVGSMLELLSAQNSLIDARQQKNAAFSNWQIARFQLLMSLGQLGFLHQHQ